MDTNQLETGLDAFVATLEAGGFAPAAGTAEWGAEHAAAHVIAANRSFTALAADLLAGGRPSYDNRPTTERTHLEAIVAAAASWEGLLAELRRSVAELVAVAGRTDEEAAARPVPFVIRDGGAVVASGDGSLADLVNGHGTFHLDRHRRQLEELRAGVASG